MLACHFPPLIPQLPDLRTCTNNKGHPIFTTVSTTEIDVVWAPRLQPLELKPQQLC